MGWNLFLRYGSKVLRPFCNPFTKVPACRDWDRFNLEEESAYQTLFHQEKPDILIHCGGICDVDKCEEDPRWANRINVKGTERLMKHLPEETRLVTVSSDHVFGGRARGYDESDPPAPISVYGQTRGKAEKIILKKKKNTLVIRAGLAVGPSANGRSGHLNWMQYRKKKGYPVTIVHDEYRSAVWAKDLAERVMALARSNICGLRHVAATRVVSRPELASAVNRKFSIGVQFTLKSRKDQPAPHLGRVELLTRYHDLLSRPLPSVCSHS